MSLKLANINRKLTRDVLVRRNFKITKSITHPRSNILHNPLVKVEIITNLCSIELEKNGPFLESSSSIRNIMCRNIMIGLFQHFKKHEKGPETVQLTKRSHSAATIESGATRNLKFPTIEEISFVARSRPSYKNVSRASHWGDGRS
jgi:hypothetical protein